MSIVTLAADQRIAKGVASSLRWTNVDEWGDPVVAGATPTVTVTRSAGTAVVTAQAATLETEPGGYALALTPTEIGDLDVLTAVWSVSSSVVATTTAEVVGRWCFTVADLRASHPMFQAQSETWIPQALAYYRDLAEREAEAICGRAFVPRFRRVTLDGSGEGELRVPDADLRSLVSVTDDGTAFTGDQVTAVKVYTSGRLERPLGEIWSFGQENLDLAYHFGLDAPPAEVRHAMMRRAAEMAALGGPAGSAISPRATSLTTDSSTINLDMADRWKTGNPDVDAVYERWSLNASGSGADGEQAPYSRSIDMNPQYDSLFHGGRR